MILYDKETNFPISRLSYRLFVIDFQNLKTFCTVYCRLFIILLAYMISPTPKWNHDLFAEAYQLILKDLNGLNYRFRCTTTT